MKDFKFIACFGDTDKEVRILDVSGTSGGSGGYHVYIDKYFCGQMFNREGKWVLFGNSASEFTQEDVEVIGERIEKEWNE